MYEKKEKMSPNHKSHMRMHYATMTALVISNLTVLGLGFLLSQAMGVGLGYFAYIDEMNRFEAHAKTATKKTETAVAGGTTAASSGDVTSCQNTCWELYQWSVTNVCEKDLAKAGDPPSLEARDEYYSCLSDAQSFYANCMVECKNSPPSTPPPSGGGSGGTSRSGTFYDAPSSECDPTQPLINCGPVSGGLTP